MTGFLSKLTPPYKRARTGDGVKYSDNWKRTHYGTLYEYVCETSEGVQLRELTAEVHKHMDSGEVEVIYRRDTQTEWHEHGCLPERARRAQRDGYVWHSELRESEDEFPGVRGSLMVRGGRKWRLADDSVEPPV